MDDFILWHHKTQAVEMYVYFICLFVDIYLFYICVCICVPACMFIYQMHSSCQRRPEEGTGAHESEVTESSELPCGCWVLNLDLCKNSENSQTLSYFSSPALYFKTKFILTSVVQH